MKVEIGPVSRSSADAWFDYADGAIDDLRRLADPRLDDGAIEAFDGLVVTWRGATGDGDSFHWVGDEEPERVEYLMRSLYRAGLAIEHAEHLGRSRLRPPEADEFHMVLVGQVLALLAAEGDAHLQFVAGLREEWGVAASHIQSTH